MLLLGVRSIDEEGVKERIKHYRSYATDATRNAGHPQSQSTAKSIFFVTFLLLAAFNVINIVIAFLLCVLAFIGVKVLNETFIEVLVARHCDVGRNDSNRPSTRNNWNIQ